jgi:hypothetical protein
VSLDTTNSDIQALGSSALAGSTGLAADAGHVHPYTGLLRGTNNLSDVGSAATSRANLGLGSAALLPSSAVAQTANNLSDLASAATARTNLGLGTSATANIDSTATDIKALGAQAAGSTGQVADAGHVHPTTGVQTAVIDSTNSDITTSAVGDAAAAGSVGKLADAGHKHGRESFSATVPTTPGATSGVGSSVSPARSDHQHGTFMFQPSDYTLPAGYPVQAWTYDPLLAGSTTAPASGQLQWVRIRVPIAITATFLIVIVSTAGATLTAGDSVLALYTAAGALLSSVTDSGTNAYYGSSGTTTGTLTAAFSQASMVAGKLAAAQSLPAGDYYIAVAATGTTIPLFRGNASLGTAMGQFLNLPFSRAAQGGTSETTAPANLPSVSSAPSIAMWAAIS